jgi:hypothetical protein
LKTWPEYFAAVLDGSKTFEARFDDREFEVGDELHLREWNPETREYTGRATRRTVSYKLNGGEFVREGYCILGLRLVDGVPAGEATRPIAYAIRRADGHVQCPSESRDALVPVATVADRTWPQDGPHEIVELIVRPAPQVLPTRAEVETAIEKLRNECYRDGQASGGLSALSHDATAALLSLIPTREATNG